MLSSISAPEPARAEHRLGQVHHWWILAVAVLAAAVGIVSMPTDGTVSPPELRSAENGVPGKPNVVQLPTPWLVRGCGRGCWNGYLELVANYAESKALPIPASSRLPSDQLAQRIIDGLAIGFLLDGLAERPLAMAILGESRLRDGVTKKRLLFWDPAVGSFDASLLMPPGRGPFPAVVGLHGHRDDDEIFAEEFLGLRLARNGIAVLMPRLRAHDCSLTENLIARKLMEQGFTLMGLRVYETLLMHKYLEHSGAVDARRVGLLSHSGGSTAANLVVRISDKFRAHVVDYQLDPHSDIACGPLKVHCETVPVLMAMAVEINDFTTLAVPNLLVPYKFSDPKLQGEIVGFFRRHLGGESTGRSSPSRDIPAPIEYVLAAAGE